MDSYNPDGIVWESFIKYTYGDNAILALEIVMDVQIIDHYLTTGLYGVVCLSVIV